MPSAGAEEMIALGIVQHPNAILNTSTTAYKLPAESAIARKDFTRLQDVANAIFAVHNSKKGLGVAAPQIGINRRVAFIRPWGGVEVCLLNARIVESSTEQDARYEGCLSLFDVRGRVQRPLRIKVQAQNFDGQVWEREFENATARRVYHELDHLDGVLYPERMNEDVIDADEYRKLPDTDWLYAE